MNIRPLRESDMNLVLSTWLKSFYEALKYYSGGSIRVPYPRDDIFFQGHQAKIKALLLTPSVKCMVCVAPDEDNQILGWTVYDHETVHYVYVKHFVRKMGIGKKLRECAGTALKYSHHTKHSRYLNKGLTYDPYRF